MLFIQTVFEFKRRVDDEGRQMMTAKRRRDQYSIKMHTNEIEERRKARKQQEEEDKKKEEPKTDSMQPSSMVDVEVHFIFEWKELMLLKETPESYVFVTYNAIKIFD